MSVFQFLTIFFPNYDKSLSQLLHFLGLGKSMSRIRFTEESSDDGLERLIKKREKRLQKRKRS